MNEKELKMSKDVLPKTLDKKSDPKELVKATKKEKLSVLNDVAEKMHKREIEKLQDDLPDAEKINDIGVEFKEEGGFYLYASKNGDKLYFDLTEDQFGKLANEIGKYSRAGGYPGYYYKYPYKSGDYYPYKRYPYSSRSKKTEGGS